MGSTGAATTSAPRTRVWRPDWPCPVGQVISHHRRGANDPTFRRTPDGSIWRGIRTPEGTDDPADPAPSPQLGTVTGEAWGSGAEWVLDRLPRMLGADDDPTGFEPLHKPIADAWRRHRHWRLGATDLVMESLVPTIIEQKVTGRRRSPPSERWSTASASARRDRPASRNRRCGSGCSRSPEQLRAIPSWEWLRLPVDGARSRPIQHAARVASSLERAGREAPDEFDRRVRTLPGIGVWTSAEVRFRALGDADAVSFGDYHIPANIGYALTGEPVDDEGLAALLEPYAGHRHRVQRLVELAGLLAPATRPPDGTAQRHLPG